MCAVFIVDCVVIGRIPGSSRTIRFFTIESYELT